MAHLRIVDISCPQQMLSFMRWSMEGNRGLVYVRVMRTPSAVLYDSDYEFEFGRGHVLKGAPGDRAVIVSSGRGVHEALAASATCGRGGLDVGVVDMPSIDRDLLLRLYDSGTTIVLAEQNNGFILQNLLKIVYRHRAADTSGLSRVLAINTLDADGRPQFIHSGTYEELTEAFGLSAEALVATVRSRVGNAGH
jgi:transketolase C-terminal domain/subunit